MNTTPVSPAATRRLNGGSWPTFGIEVAITLTLLYAWKTLGVPVAEKVLLSFVCVVSALDLIRCALLLFVGVLMLISQAGRPRICCHPVLQACCWIWIAVRFFALAWSGHEVVAALVTLMSIGCMVCVALVTVAE